MFPELAEWLNPPVVSTGGDGDTVQAASISTATGYTVGSTSVARFVFDLSDWQRSAWVVPLGASGHPGSPHYADQSRHLGRRAALSNALRLGADQSRRPKRSRPWSRRHDPIPLRPARERAIGGAILK